jgi:hypothetical protein
MILIKNIYQALTRSYTKIIAICVIGQLGNVFFSV